MNTWLDDRASWVGSAISVGTLPLRRTTQWCITPQNTWRKHQRVRKCPSKHLNPTRRRVREDTFIEHRNSKAFRFFENRRATRQFSDTSPGQFKYLKAKIIYKVMRHKKYYGILRDHWDGLQTLWAGHS